MSEAKVEQPTSIAPKLAQRVLTPKERRELLWTKEEKAKLVEQARQISGFMYADHNARWIAKHLTAFFETLLGESMAPKPQRSIGTPQAQEAGGGQQGGPLPRGARIRHVEVKDASGKVIKEVVDDLIFDVEDDGTLVNPRSAASE